MGPLLDSSGEASDDRVAFARPSRASMGPLLDSSGESRTASRMARHHGDRASMGPLLDSSGEADAVPGGAAGARVASMGPLLDSSGESWATLDAAPTCSAGFNGAAARQQRRDRRAGGFQRLTSVRLQWGRCSTAAESMRLPGGDRCAPVGAASMGPLLDSSGESTPGGTAEAHVERLQWGRCSTAAESRGRFRPMADPSVRRRFNGAAARQQRRAGDRGRASIPHGFNGAAARQQRRGDQPARPGHVDDARRFNGAAARQQRRGVRRAAEAQTAVRG